MQTPQLDPTPTPPSPSHGCRHKRLVDRILTDNGKESGKVRCLECGEVIADQTPPSVQ